MKVSELNNKRFEVALELFEQGQRFNFSDVSFYLDKKNKILEVVVISNWQIQNLNEEKAWRKFKGVTAFLIILSNETHILPKLLRTTNKDFHLLTITEQVLLRSALCRMIS